MAGERKHLPPLETFMEQMYGVEPKELTPEEKAHIRKLIEQSAAKELRQTGRKGTSLEYQAQMPPVGESGDATSVGAAPEGFDPWSHFQNQRSQFFPEGANAGDGKATAAA